MKIPKRLLPKGNGLSDVGFDETWLSQNDYKKNQVMKKKIFDKILEREGESSTTKKIIELSKAGIKQKDIALKVNRSRQWISYVLKNVLE